MAGIGSRGMIIKICYDYQCHMIDCFMLDIKPQGSGLDIVCQRPLRAPGQAREMTAMRK